MLYATKFSNACGHCLLSFPKRMLSSKDLIVRREYLCKLQECYRLEETQQIVVPQFKRALLYGNNIAVKDSVGEYTYFQLYVQSKRLSRQISNICGSCSCSTIGLIYSNNVLRILCLWACWMSGQVVMPLVIGPECEYSQLPELLLAANIKIIINSKSHEQLESSSNRIAHALNISHIAIDHSFMKQHNHPLNLKREIFIADNMVFFEGLLQNNFYTKALALCLYYKNDWEIDKWEFVSVTHKQLDMRMKLLVQTWNITADDRVLNIFCTQQAHNFVESGLFALNKGCCLYMMDQFDAANVWSIIMGINIPAKERVNVLMADAKIYEVLITEYDKLFQKNTRMSEYIKNYFKDKLRLVVSCYGKVSAETYGRWLEISGHSLFENSSVYSSDMIKKENSEDHKDQELMVKNLSLASGDLNFRIVDSANKVLLECNGKSSRKLFTSSSTIVGSLWISCSSGGAMRNAGKATSYFSTGDVVMYQDGVFKFIGRCKN